MKYYFSLVFSLAFMSFLQAGSLTYEQCREMDHSFSNMGFTYTTVAKVENEATLDLTLDSAEQSISVWLRHKGGTPLREVFFPKKGEAYSGGYYDFPIKQTGYHPHFNDLLVEFSNLKQKGRVRFQTFTTLPWEEELGLDMQTYSEVVQPLISKLSLLKKPKIISEASLKSLECAPVLLKKYFSDFNIRRGYNIANRVIADHPALIEEAEKVLANAKGRDAIGDARIKLDRLKENLDYWTKALPDLDEAFEKIELIEVE